MYTKVCTKCSKEQPLTNFYKSSRSKDGRQTHCKACQRAYADSHSEEAKERSRQHRERTKEGQPPVRKHNKRGGPGTLFYWIGE